MSLVNPNIAMSFRMPEFQAPNALAQYAQLQQIQGGQQAQELNALKMQEAQAAMQERNALRQLNPAAEDYENQLFRVNPTLGIAYRKEAATTAAQRAAQKASEFELKAKQRKFLDDAKRNLSSNPSDDNVRSWGQDAVIDGIYTPEQAERTVQQLLAIPPADRAQILAQSGASAADLRPQPVAPGSSLVQGGKAVFTAPFAPEKPPAPTNLAKLQDELAALPPGDPRRAQYEALIRKEITPVAGTTIKLPPQENAFESGLGKGQSERILANQVAAQDAAEILRTNQVGRDLLKAGAITGTGADFLVGFNNALKQVGIDFGYADAAANSQAYVATLGANVGRIIKQFGAGTGLSDADRDFAEKIAGGKIALTETALRKILDINDRASNRVIDLHNKNVSGIKTNIPLTVEKPVFQRPAPSAANQIPGNAPAPAAAPAARTVVRTGTLNGRRVIQYSDGSTEYGN
jgi:hypothetical protein